MTKEVEYEPDSSPKAWRYYQKIYEGGKLLKNYELKNPVFYIGYKDRGLKTGHNEKEKGKWYNYINEPIQTKAGYCNRKYALQIGTATYNNGEIEYIEAARRLGGECDFNFNEGKCYKFTKIIETSKDVKLKEQAKEKLNRCKEMHHNYLNFSLMEAMGNMQGFKGLNKYDRLDVFVYNLDSYFNGLTSNVLSESSGSNRWDLIGYLAMFENIYDYCKEVYLLTDKTFIDEIIKQGKLPIKNCNDVVRYMDLAIKFWKKKIEYIYANINELNDEEKGMLKEAAELIL